MRREEAEKLLAALIFGDLDEASKTDLVAYLQTDDELRERLADMRMAVKVASDALQHGPDPVLSKRHLKRLARLAGRSNRRSALFTVRYMAAAAAILAAVMLPSFLIFNRTNKPKLLYSLKPGIDIGGGYSVNENGKYDLEFSGGSSVPFRLVQDMPESYAETAEESPEGNKQFAKATRRKDIADAIVEYSRQRPVGNGAKFGDGHLTFEGDADEIAGGGTAQVAVDADGGGNAIVIERRHYYNVPIDAVVGESSSATVKFNWEADGGPGGAQYKLHVDPATGIERHRVTAPPGGEIDRRMDSSVVTGDVDRWRSALDAKMPAAAGKPLISPPKFEPVRTKSESPPSPVVVSGPSKGSEPGLRDEAVVPEIETMNTGSIAAESIRVPPISNMILVDGSRSNVISNPTDPVSARENSEPSGTVHDEITINSWGKDQVFEEAQKGQTSSREVSGISGTVHDKIYTLPSKGNRTVSHNAIGNADSFLMDDDFELAKAENGSGLEDSPVTGPVADHDGDNRLFGAEEMEETSESLDDIISVAKKGAPDAKKLIGFEVDLPDSGVLRVDGSGVPVGEDETDLPQASRFKSVPVNPWVMTERDPLSTFALDVDTASYTLCRRYINGGFLPPAGAVRMEEFVNYFNYHYPQRTNRTFTVHAEATRSPFADKGKNLTLLKIGVKARTLGRDQRKAAHLIFVVDASASMGKPDRLGLVQQALSLLVDRLSPADRVTLITCANESRLHLEAVSARERERIRNAIDAIQSSGPTNLLAGLKLGYAVARRSFAAKQINHVVLCSDGVANVGQTNAEAVLRDVAADRKQGITLTCVGVGYGSYNDAFMEALANSGDGSYVFLDSMRQAQRVFVEQLSATLHTVAKDARIQVDFNPDRVRRYRLIGYENRDIEDKRFRDDTVDAGEVGSGQCSTALYELELTGQAAADQQGDMGTVFVRYRNADTGQMEEISSRLKSAIVRRRTVKSSPRFFLAAAAARFAEILRQSEHAQGGSLTEVLGIAERVSLTLPLDRDVRQLLELIRKSEHLPRSP